MAADSVEPSGDLVLAARPGLPDGLVIHAAELAETFALGGGAGGESVNRDHSKVQLRWDIAHSSSLSDDQRGLLLDRRGDELHDGSVLIVAAEHPSQYDNRELARERLASWLDEAFDPGPPRRIRSGPPADERAARLDDKRRRGAVKDWRKPVQPDDDA